MRIATLATLIIATVASAGPVRAQTYNPNYPVCMQVYSPFQYFDCSFFSIRDCKVSASGRGAQCVVNPYFAGEPPPVRRRRHVS
jgi:hypothetical protein